MCVRRNLRSRMSLEPTSRKSHAIHKMPLPRAVGVRSRRPSYYIRSSATQPGDQPTRTQTDTDDIIWREPSIDTDDH